MTRQRFAYTVGLWCILLTLLMPATQCAKEYSYEGGPMVDTATNGDTTTGNGDTTSTSSLHLPTCPSCNNITELQPNTWMFTVNGTVVCGNVTRAIKSAEGTAMTFFGPSACSGDTGLIITAYFTPPGLLASTTNLLAHHAALEYYDNVTPSDIAAAFFTAQFSVVMERYSHQSGAATGTFSGQAHTANGEPVTITAGKFNIMIE